MRVGNPQSFHDVMLGDASAFISKRCAGLIQPFSKHTLQSILTALHLKLSSLDTGWCPVALPPRKLASIYSIFCVNKDLVVDFGVLEALFCRPFPRTCNTKCHLAACPAASLRIYPYTSSPQLADKPCPPRASIIWSIAAPFVFGWQLCLENVSDIPLRHTESAGRSIGPATLKRFLRRMKVHRQCITVLPRRYVFPSSDSPQTALLYRPKHPIRGHAACLP